jgi:ubiquitin C-terminal hydrolase
LKRFHFSSWRRDKISSPVEFPITNLDLKKFSGNSSKAIFNKVAHETAKNPLYNLFAISHHSGSLNGGHYVA